VVAVSAEEVAAVSAVEAEDLEAEELQGVGE
jgi:hypothetical protein